MILQYAKYHGNLCLALVNELVPKKHLEVKWDSRLNTIYNLYFGLRLLKLIR